MSVGSGRLQKRNKNLLELIVSDSSLALYIRSYVLPREIYLLCKHFAFKSYATNEDCYSRRGQSDITKVTNDITIGKLAEWGVFFMYLQEGRHNISSPDMNIYSVRQKSYDPDLKWGLYRLHIKSQTLESSERYGSSWMFQAKDPLFAKSDNCDIIIGCRVGLNVLEDDSCLVEIQLEKPFDQLVIGEPKLSKFSNGKKAIYLKDNV
jgi:hypothetical protein